MGTNELGFDDNSFHFMTDENNTLLKIVDTLVSNR